MSFSKQCHLVRTAANGPASLFPPRLSIPEKSLFLMNLSGAAEAEAVVWGVKGVHVVSGVSR